MKPKRRNKLSMSLIFSLFVCVNFVITGGIVSIAGFILHEAGVIAALGHLAPIVVILIVLFASILVGTAVSMAIGKYPLRPVRRVIAQMEELAGGNFNARLDIARPPELHNLAESFNSMAKELGSIEMLRADFVNNFSHEFKTPIVSIKGFAELLKYGDLTDEEKNEYLDIVISESSRLAELSNSILYLSKIENQEILFENETFDVGEQIRHIVLLLQNKWESKRINMNLDLQDVYLCGCEEMLEQVWLNLIGNAIKFTPEGGTVRIRMVQEAERIKIAIADTGCGISPEALPRIFDRFYQGDASHAMEGNGLGLTLASKIIALHNGRIQCDGEVNQGAVFTVELPVS